MSDREHAASQQLPRVESYFSSLHSFHGRPEDQGAEDRSIWHGLVEGYPEIDKRGLTAEIAERKAKDALVRLRERLEREW